MATPLGHALSTTTKTPGPAASAFQQALAGSRVCERYELRLPNGVQLECGMILVGSDTLLDIEGRVRKEMELRGVPADVITQGNYELCRAKHTLAVALVLWDPKLGAAAPRLGTHSEIGALSPEEISAAYTRFGELRELHDPLAEDVVLSPTDIAELRAAITEKKTPLLRYFGLQRLIAFMLSSECQLAPSPTPKSEPGPSQPES